MLSYEEHVLLVSLHLHLMLELTLHQSAPQRVTLPLQPSALKQPQQSTQKLDGQQQQEEKKQHLMRASMIA